MLNPLLARSRPKSMESRARSWPMIPSSGASSSVVRKEKKRSSQDRYRSSGESTLAMHPSFVIGKGGTDIPRRLRIVHVHHRNFPPQKKKKQGEKADLPPGPFFFFF